MPPLGETTVVWKLIRRELFVAFPCVLLMPCGSWQTLHEALTPAPLATCLK
jgi:hypothetical protein